MSMNVNPVSFSGVSKAQSAGASQSISKAANVSFGEEQDAVQLTKKETALTKEAKRELIHKARSKAAGYSCFGGVWSTLYYGLRSDKKVAEKYNLDEKEDKALIKKMKQEQLLFTLPAVIGLGIVGYIMAKVSSPDKIDPDKMRF